MRNIRWTSWEFSQRVWQTFRKFWKIVRLVLGSLWESPRNCSRKFWEVCIKILGTCQRSSEKSSSAFCKVFGDLLKSFQNHSCYMLQHFRKFSSLQTSTRKSAIKGSLQGSFGKLSRMFREVLREALKKFWEVFSQSKKVLMVVFGGLKASTPKFSEKFWDLENYQENSGSGKF